MVTIYDLARVTGFSAPTVSKALNGTGKLSEETRKKILETAQSMNYKANMAARALTTKHTKLIGVILEDVSKMRGFEHPLFGGVLNTFRMQMENAGYDLLFLSKSLDKTMSYLDHCRYRDVEGVLIVNPPDGPDMLEFTDSGIPCVSTNEIIPGVCAVISNNEESGFKATDIFIKAGHKNIGFIGPEFKENSPASLDRFNGYKKALASAGIEYRQERVEVCAYWDSESGYEAAVRLFQRAPELTALFAANDTIAYGVMKYLKEKGKKIPDDVSLIGFDDDRMAEYTSPSLCTFRQNRDKIAEMAAELLLQSVAGVPVPDVVRVEAEYISRNSVAEIR